MGSLSKLESLTNELTALQDENQRLKDLYYATLECSTEGFWNWDIQKDWQYMSPRFWEILGQDHTKMKPHPSEWQKLLHPDDLVNVLKSFDRHVESKGSVPYDNIVRYNHPVKGWIEVRCRGKVVQWDGGKPIRMVGTHILRKKG